MTTRIGIIVGSTRPRRRAKLVAAWVEAVAKRHLATIDNDVSVEIIDLVDFHLPLLDEPIPAAIGEYHNPHTLQWAKTINAFDGFIVVTPEYNHSIPAALKNAIDYLFAEWHNKAAGFVGYGLQGGMRAVEHLRQVMAEVKVADVRTAVALSLFNDFTLTDMSRPGEVTPGPHQEPTLTRLIDEVVAWSDALAPLRQSPGDIESDSS